MKSSISNLRQLDFKSFSLDKPNMKRRSKNNKQINNKNNNKNNNVIFQDKKITPKQQKFNKLIISQKTNRQIKREKSVDLIHQKPRESSPDFCRDASKINKRLITNSPFKKSLRKSKNILNKSNESTSSKSFESEDKITPTYFYRHNFINHPKKKKPIKCF